jgi:probable HAF family extracellular repeat protein
MHSGVIKFIILLAWCSVIVLTSQPVFSAIGVTPLLPSGASSSSFLKCNDNSQTVGVYVDQTTGNQQPILFNDVANSCPYYNDQTILLPLAPYGDTGVANSIERRVSQGGNNITFIVGAITNSNGKKQAVSWYYTVDAGICGHVQYGPQLLNVPSTATMSEALGTNGTYLDNVGYYKTSDTSPTTAILFSGPVTLDSLSPGSSKAYAVNNSRRIVGMSEISTGVSHAVMWNLNRKGKFAVTDLGAIRRGGAQSAAYDVNGSGQIVGENGDELGQAGAQAVTWVPKGKGVSLVVLPVTAANYTGSVATAVADYPPNSDLTMPIIVGWGIDTSEKKVALLWAPSKTGYATAIALPTISGYNDCMANGLNGEGDMVVGTCSKPEVETDPSTVAVRWTGIIDSVYQP